MVLVEARTILQEKKVKVPVLSVALAERMNGAVGEKLDDSVTLKDLYYATHTNPNLGAGPEWFDFVISLESGEKGAITISLGGLTYINPEHDVTVGDIRNIDDIKTFAKQRGLNKSEFGLSFFKLAFSNSEEI